MSRSIAKRAGLGLSVAAAILLTLEGLSRAIYGPPPPPTRVFEAIGTRDTYFVKTRSGHFRPAYQRPNAGRPFTAEGANRVAFLGGSSVHDGTPGVVFSGEFPGILGRDLGVTGLNLATPGLDSFDLVALVKELDPVELDALVVYAGHNDIGNTLFKERYVDTHGVVSATLLPVFQRSRLYLALDRTLRWPGGPKIGDSAGDSRMTLELPPLDAARRSELHTRFDENINQIVDLCAERSLPLVLVVPVSDLPSGVVASPCEDDGCLQRLMEVAEGMRASDPAGAAELYREARDGEVRPLRATSEIEESIRRHAGTDGVWVVDAPVGLPQSRGLPSPSLFFDFIHFNADGHEAMAELIEPTLRDALGVADPPSALDGSSAPLSTQASREHREY